MAPPNEAAVTERPARLTSLDALRGFVMFLMGVELLQLDEVAKKFPDSTLWQTIGYHAWHAPWTGCSLHDLIHPAFAFMVGVALPFSLASRRARGQSLREMSLHAGWRSFLLIFLGIFVHSLGRSITNWTFEETLTQMGLGYPFLFLLAFARQRIRWIALAGILVSYWLLFVSYPILPTNITNDDFNIPEGWPHHATGFFAHWNLNRNVAWSFDAWFLNLFPRNRPFVGYLGGYNTLNFIPTLGTMILGLIAGTWLREDTTSTLLKRLLLAGLACLGLGWGMEIAGICPIIKKIWTPAWTLYSGGWSFLLMATFYFIMDVKKLRAWAFPFVVIGMNSIAMYLLFHTIDEFLAETLQQHLTPKTFLLLGPDLQPVLLGSAVLLSLWLILLWMHQRKIYLRV